MFLPPTIIVTLGEQARHDKLREASQWRLAKLAEATRIEDSGWRWGDIMSAIVNHVRLAFSWLARTPSRTGAAPAAAQPSLWQA